MHDPIITETTRRNYEKGWRRWSDWCAEEGRDPLDGDGPAVAEWLYELNRRGYAPGTLRLSCAGVAHRYATDPALLGRADPTKTDDARTALARIDRAAARSGRGTKKATALTPELLVKVLEVSAERRSGESAEVARLRHLEADATLRLMCDSLLRADEMVRARWSDLSTAPDPATGGRTLYVGVSKTDQNGNGRYGHVSPPTWAALCRWRAASPDPDDRISTAPTAGALSARIRRLGRMLGIELSGHSPRRGTATALGHAGASEYELMHAGGWKSTDTVREYVDAPNAARNAVTKLYDNGHEGDPMAHLWPVPGADDERDARKVQARTRLALLVEQSRLGVLIDPDHERYQPVLAPLIADARAEVLRLWPESLPPPRDCARPGCFGIDTEIANARSGEPHCSDDCARAMRNERKRQARRSNRQPEGDTP